MAKPDMTEPKIKPLFKTSLLSLLSCLAGALAGGSLIGIGANLLLVLLVVTKVVLLVVVVVVGVAKVYSSGMKLSVTL